MKTLNHTKYQFPKQKEFYRGKVREVYNIDNRFLVMIATDRLSAFDVILPKQIPYKGQILNKIAAKMLQKTSQIVPNWVLDVPHPNVTIGYFCEPIQLEMVVRGYLTGHAWRLYKEGKRIVCGVKLPEGMQENQKFETPIITPSTKATIGNHDVDISKEQIVKQKIVKPEEYDLLEKYSSELFQKGTQIAQKQNLILVDTKYEFGKTLNGKVLLIDEIHTPDSSRYFYENTYKDLLKKGLPQKQLSKEFVRQWLIENHFQGKKGQMLPNITNEKVLEISERYLELYEKIMGESLKKKQNQNLENDIEKAILKSLEKIQNT